MLLSAVSTLVVAQSSSEIPEGLMNNPVNTIIVVIYCPSAFVRASKLNTITNVVVGVRGGAVG